MNNLNAIINKFEILKSKSYDSKFCVPSLWLEQFDDASQTIDINPCDYFIGRLERIKQISEMPKSATSSSIVYNMFVRLAAAFDHNNSNNLENEYCQFKQTGTFLKAISMLPYLKSLGVGTIYLLPITSIGYFGNKGNLGSPYSIKNHYSLDENLSEPLLEMTVEEQFKAFIEAARLLDMKIILEFVFRTSSLDSELAIEHPDWFYWIKDSGSAFLPPKFEEEELAEIKLKIESDDLSELPAPSESYIEMFDTPEGKPFFNEEGKILAKSKNGELLTIPNAFADWPPDDKQPLWSDVTYLKLYDNPKFNYIAYNTVRMYDEELSKEKYENKSLWHHLTNVIPYYIENFDIDGVMIDMGHSLPTKLRNEITEKARSLKKDFIFWEENFSVTKKSKDEGYDAVLGYVPFDAHIPWKLKGIIRDFANKSFPIDFFLTPETHNTKRAAMREGGVEFSKLIWCILSFFPSLKFIHNGFELGETTPVNTGLGFEPEELSAYPAKKLPLFSTAVLDWTNPGNIVSEIQKFTAISDYYKSEIGVGEYSNFKLIEDAGDDIVAFTAEENILVIGNFSSEPTEVKFAELLPKKQVEMYYSENVILSIDAENCEMPPFSLFIAIISDC